MTRFSAVSFLLLAELVRSAFAGADPGEAAAPPPAKVVLDLDKDELLAACAERLLDPRLSSTALRFLESRTIEGWKSRVEEGVDWRASAEPLAAAWSAFLRENREALCSGRTFELGKPPVTPDLFPRGVLFTLPDGTVWPERDRDL